MNFIFLKKGAKQNKQPKYTLSNSVSTADKCNGGGRKSHNGDKPVADVTPYMRLANSTIR